MTGFAQDVAFACRLAARNPRFYPAVFGIVVFCVGVTTAMSGVVNAQLFFSVPFPRSESLTLIQGQGVDKVSLLDAQAWKSARSFEVTSVAKESFCTVRFPDGARAAVVNALVRGDYFAMLGISPRLGRLLRP
ncbi:MAG: hypothetical protein JOZ69_19405, partial [Myxococcales bacterium]|nr:hypothetical protein [Myxococcales bacterium]